MPKLKCVCVCVCVCVRAFVCLTLNQTRQTANTSYCQAWVIFMVMYHKTSEIQDKCVNEICIIVSLQPLDLVRLVVLKISSLLSS